MEVKIKNNNEMIDATIEMVDGVMVVSPKRMEWKPKRGEPIFYPSFFVTQFLVSKSAWLNEINDNTWLHKGWLFKTEKECQEFCCRLNKAINSVKP